MIKPGIIILIILLTFSSVFAQQITINGKVRDTNTHFEIPSVNIFIKETQLGTISDFTGRFSLKIINPGPGMIVVFQHIGYDIQEISLDSVKELQNIYLQPRVIPLPGLKIEAPGERIEIKKDLPQAVSVLESRNFEIRGFTDAGDFLRTDHSVQIDEDLSGKKTVAIRGGNPDEVVVLYNGIKLNSAFDNVFDLSLIDLEDLERFEIIKGSNTALYGSGALAGIINIVPKVQQDYNIRFQQRIGTYNSGNWGIHLYQHLKRLHASYSFKQGSTKRQFIGELTSNEQLVNRTTHHTANLAYDFSKHNDESAKNLLSAMYIRSSLDYDNQKDLESLSNLNQIISLRYEGDIYKLKNLNISSSYHQLDEDQNLIIDNAQYGNRKILNDSYYLNLEKCWEFRQFDLLFTYQLEDAELEFQDLSNNLDTQLKRQHHGFVAIAKVHALSGSAFIPYLNFDLSMRHDRVRDEKMRGTSSSGFSHTDTQSWDETLLKFSSNVDGSNENIAFSAYMNVGKNVKFPTLFQQISQPLFSEQMAARPNLNPEKNSSMEIGFEIVKNNRDIPIIYGWQLAGNLFKNYYENKFRSFYTPGIPVAFYDNVQTAHISGLEMKSSAFLFRKKVTIELGLSRYSISEKAAFPFKYDRKATADFKIDHAGYAFLFHLFKEGEQIGWVRQSSEGFVEIELPSHTDIDLHLSKAFEFGKFKLKSNVSVRNLLNNDVDMAGIALRDRRVYFTIGIQY